MPTSSGGSSCTGVVTFAVCTAYSAGAQVQYKGVLYQALASINNTRDCPPTAPYNPTNDNWWQNLGACAAGTAATPTPTPVGSGGGTTGTLNFHMFVGTAPGPSSDSITLDGGNYNDLIMSNMIAGVMLGHIVKEGFPGMQYNPDYMYGSIMGQLLQENLATEDYVSTSNLIDPSPDQQGVMAAGQGGPYQINNYVLDMVNGSVPAGHALVNYILIQKNIGYTISGSQAQANLPTPPSFNNKYYGPMLPTFFHYNDMVALTLIGGNGYTPPWEPQYGECLTNFVNLPNNFLDIVLNVAYNQGYYGGLVSYYSNLGATATASTIATVDNYSSVQGSTYGQYPYQVRDYADQMYDKPVPSNSLTNLVTPTNHIDFDMPTLENVFTNVFETLSYSNGTNPSQFFTAAQAQAAFNSALSQNGVSSTAVLDLSTAADRTKIFAVIDSALSNLESAVGMKFNATTTSQL